MITVGAEGLTPGTMCMEATMKTRIVSIDNVDRRGTSRLPLSGPLPAVMLPEYPQRTEVLVHDISPLGLGMYLERPVKPGTLLSVEVYNNAGGFWHFKVVRVIHATPLDDSRWMVGSVFLTRLSREEFQGVLAPNYPSDEREFQP